MKNGYTSNWCRGDLEASGKGLKQERPRCQGEGQMEKIQCQARDRSKWLRDRPPPVTLKFCLSESLSSTLIKCFPGPLLASYLLCLLSYTH